MWSWYTCMPNFRPFLPCVLLRMPGNPSYTNLFWLPEGQNWVNTDQNGIISEGVQDTSACHISGHSSIHFPWNSQKPQLHKVFLATREDRNWATNTSACHISDHSFHAPPLEARKPKFHYVFWPPASQNWVSTGQNRINSGGGQDTACHISSHYFHVFSLKCAEISPDGRTDGRTLCPHPISPTGTNMT